MAHRLCWPARAPRAPGKTARRSHRAACRLLSGALSTLLTSACAPAGTANVPVRWAIQAEVVAERAGATDPDNWYLERVRAQSLPKSPYSNQVVVAVVDTGVDPQQPALRARLLPLIDVVGSDTYAVGALRDDYRGRDGNGHGTHVAGLVAAVSGAANPFMILPVKAIDRTGVGDDSAIAQGIRRAVDYRDPAHPERRVRVVNLSIGGKTSSRTLEDALAYAARRDVLVVVAAGNRDRDVDYPAALPSALAVSATTISDGLAGYSNRGSSVGISAPGGDSEAPISSDWPSYLTATDRNRGTAQPHRRATMMGTSMAAPLVSGAAGVLFSQDPYLSAEQVRSRLTTWSADLGPVGPDGYFGAGRLDLAAALSKGGHDAR